MTEPETTPSVPTSEPAGISSDVESPALPPARTRGPIVAIAVVVALMAIVLAWTLLMPGPDLEPARRLIEAGNFPEAKANLTPILARAPRNPEVRAAMAEVLVNVDPPEPIEALRLLEGLKPATSGEAAFLQVIRGRAYRLTNRPAKAEAAWRDALRLDPLVAEAGWRLIDQFYTEGRDDELRSWALRLHKREPDPVDRVRLLLEAMRPDAEPLAAAGVVSIFKPVIETDPDDRYAALAYYKALAKDGTGIDEALRGLRRIYERNPSDPASLDGLVYGLIAAGDVDGLSATLAALPTAEASDHRLAFARGWLAEARKDDETAAREYALALIDQPSHAELLARLRGAYHRLKKDSEEAAIAARQAAVEAARVELRGIKGREQEIGRPGLFEEAIQRPTLGRVPDPELYKRLANVREAMGHPDEAIAWHRLVLKSIPDDAESREAIKRLETDAPKPVR